jgi:hypothetical protein
MRASEQFGGVVDARSRMWPIEEGRSCGSCARPDFWRGPWWINGQSSGGGKCGPFIKASAERRPGKPLLNAYMFVALFGVVVCVVVMHL